MQPKVSNIKVEDHKFGNIVGILEKAYPFITLSTEDCRTIKRLTPTHTKNLTYEVRDANTALCNGWRRIILDELIWPRLTCTLEDVRSDDAFCQRMTDYIQNRVWLIPTSYVAMSDKQWTFTLDVKNTTTQPIIVKSNEILMKDGDSKFIFAREVDIIELLPGRFIKINLTLEWGRNLSHASFSNFNGVIYQPLEFLDALAANAKTELPPSYSLHPTDYRLGFTCEEFIDPMHSALMAWHVMREKLQTAHDNIQTFITQKLALPYYSDVLNVTQIKGNRIRYEFLHETYTLGNLLAWYAYQHDKSIEYILAGDDHPEDLSILVKLTHKDHARLLQTAALAAIKHIDIIVSGLH